MPYDVFLSHSSHDKASADAVCAALEASGVPCWIAPRDIPPGVEWSTAIVRGLRECRVLLLLYTAASNESPQVLREVERAVSLRLPIITLKLEEAALTHGMEYFISVTHWLTAVGVPLEACLPELVDSVRGLLRRDADGDRAGTPPSQFAGGGPDTAPPFVLQAPSAPPPPHNLPALLDGFIGRDREAETARALLLADETCLVTIRGTGGLGKTRLSQEVAHALLAGSPAPFPDGIFAAELAPVTDAALVPQAVADALAVRDDRGSGRTVTQALVAALRGKRLLLLLDNCEHVLYAAATLAAVLLSECPTVRLLATSRERLGIRAERVIALGPLGLPTSTALAEVADSAAGRLFAQRAQAVSDAFRLAEANAGAVAEICRRLDGIPLAIELAAARARVLTPQQIAQRLDQRFRLLTGGNRDLLPHQQTLRALIDWSFDLLSDPEKALLCRLAAFAGGWTLEAAEAVGAGGDVEDWEVMDHLLSLVDKSLVAADSLPGRGNADGTRYRLLETIRQYARERLGEGGEEEAVRDRHADYFKRLAARSAGVQANAELLDVLEADQDNLRAALDWLIARERSDAAAEMAITLKEFWWKRGWIQEGRSVLNRLLEQEADMRGASRSALLGAAGWLAHLQADYEAADHYQKSSLTLCRMSEDAEGEANALNNLALGALSRGRVDEARELFEGSLAIARHLGDDAKVAARLCNLGLLGVQEGHFAEARERLDQARDVYARLRDRNGQAACLCNLAELALRQEQWQEAEALSRDSLALFREMNDRPGVAYSLTNLAEAALHVGALDSGLEHTGEALSLCVEAGMFSLLPTLAEVRAKLFAARGEPESATLCRAAADALRQSLKAPRMPEEQEELDRTVPHGGATGTSNAASEFGTLAPEAMVTRLLAAQDHRLADKDT